MRTRLSPVLAFTITAGLLGSCGVTPNTGTFDERQRLHAECMSSLSEFQAADPSLSQRMDSAYAYAIFPRVVNAAIGLGGAHGNGEVYQNGRLIGYADMSQGNLGAQLGAQKYAELILFENERPLTDFQHCTVEFDARGSAVAAASGSAAAADYSHGVLVFSLPETGLMLQAAIGGQKFRYTPAAEWMGPASPAPSPMAP